MFSGGFILNISVCAVRPDISAWPGLAARPNFTWTDQARLKSDISACTSGLSWQARLAALVQTLVSQSGV